MTNNFDLIRNMLHFDEKDSFYFCQIIKRRKDPGNENMSHGEEVIKSYYIYSFEQFDRLKETIINLCNFFNARACFNLGVRSAKRCTLQLLKDLTEHIMSEEWNCNGYLFDSAAGQTCSEKLWLIDIDKEFLDISNEISEFIETLPPVKEKKIRAIIPSRTGLHLITHPFNKYIFENHQFSNGISGFNIDIHKNGPTILYTP